MCVCVGGGGNVTIGNSPDHATGREKVQTLD